MKRREMIKAAGTLAVAPLFFNNAVSPLVDGLDLFRMSSKVKRFADGRDWFFEKRYGMFVHWGLYSIPGWHEQHQWRARVPRAEYAKLINQWNPAKFNPEEWLDLMENAGMKYLTVTTKHHDGFCMWDTKLTKFNTMNSPYKQDILGKLSEACQKRKMPLCLYYSIVDWNHPNYPNQGRHHELSGPEYGDEPDWDKYMDFLKGQVKELCSNYGEIHGFWWDMNVPVYKDPSINNMIRILQPKAVINNRGFDDGDFGTPERDNDIKSSDAPESERPVEACQSVGMESWGYKKDEDYYTDRHLSRSIDKYLSHDGNYLLNVGPKSDGQIPEQSSAILKRLGVWYLAVKESYENTDQASQLAVNQNITLTSKGNVLYVHFNKDLVGNGFKLKPINVLPKHATLLNDGSKVECIVNLSPSDHLDQKAYLRLRNLPANSMENTVLVVKLEFDRPLNEISLGKPDTGITGEKWK